MKIIDNIKAQLKAREINLIAHKQVLCESFPRFRENINGARKQSELISMLDDLLLDQAQDFRRDLLSAIETRTETLTKQSELDCNDQINSTGARIKWLKR